MVLLRGGFLFALGPGRLARQLGGADLGLFALGLVAVLATVDVTTAGAVVILVRLCSFWFFVFVCGIAASMAAVGVRQFPMSVDAVLAPATDGAAIEDPVESR